MSLLPKPLFSLLRAVRATGAAFLTLALASTAAGAQKPSLADVEWGGRVQLDHGRFDGVYSRDGASHQASYLRRGTLLGSWRWHPQWSLAGAVELDSDGRLALDSLALGWQPREGLRLRAGRLDPDFGLEPATSSNWTFGVERSAIWDLVPDVDDAEEGTGLRVDAHGTGWAGSAGLYDKRGYSSLVARGVWQPGAQGSRLGSKGSQGGLHLGASVAHSQGWRDDGRLRTRLGLRAVTEDALGRRSTLGAAAQAPAAYDGDFAWALEAAWQQGPLLVQAEALQRRLAGTGGAASRTAQGAYVLAAWSITGEPRRYDEDRGRFRGPKPQHPRWGAWEVFYRLDSLSVNDGGSATVHTLGLGWTAADTWRAMLNLHSARSDDANALGQTRGQGLALRLQATF